MAGHERVSKMDPTLSSRQRLSGHSRDPRRVEGMRVEGERSDRGRLWRCRGVERTRADRAPYAPLRFDVRL